MQQEEEVPPPFAVVHSHIMPSQEQPEPCVVCRDRLPDVKTFPCGHVVMCEDCAVQIMHGDSQCWGLCPVDREPIAAFAVRGGEVVTPENARKVTLPMHWVLVCISPPPRQPPASWTDNQVCFPPSWHRAETYNFMLMMDIAPVQT